MLVLSASDVDAAAAGLSVDGLIDLMAVVFRALSLTPEGVQCPPRLSLDMTRHTALVMPGRVDGTGTALKVVSVPKHGSGLPASTLVLDESTGAVKALLNAGNLTALRTAAGSALATRLLLGNDARPTRIVAFGAGAQIKAHIRLLLALYPSLTECTIVNRALNARTSDLVAAFSSKVRTSAMTNSPNVESAVRDADIIVAATSSEVSLFESDWVKPGAHIVLVGSYKPTMREAPDELIRRARLVLVDSREACAVEAGELISSGIGRESMVEVGEVVDDPAKVSSIRAAGDVTIFKSVGIAAQDVAIACAVTTRAEELGLGASIDFDA